MLTTFGSEIGRPFFVRAVSGHHTKVMSLVCLHDCLPHSGTFKDKYKKMKESYSRYREESNERVNELEQEKMMVDLQLNEMQVRSRTAAATQRNKVMHLDDQLQAEQEKVMQLSVENQQLTYDNEELVARIHELEEGKTIVACGNARLLY